MAQKILSDITLQKDAPKALRFAVVFIDIMGKTKEYIFYDNSIRQCVIKCIALINYMFRYGGMSVVYIYPTNDTTILRTVYGKADGMSGIYKLIEGPIEGQMSLDYVRGKFLDD